PSVVCPAVARERSSGGGRARDANAEESRAQRATSARAGAPVQVPRARRDRPVAAAAARPGAVGPVARAATTGSPSPSAPPNGRATTAAPTGGAITNRRGRNSQAARVEYAWRGHYGPTTLSLVSSAAMRDYRTSTLK